MHDRVTEAEAPGDIRRPDHVEVEQLVDRREGFRFTDSCGRRRQFRLEALPGNGGAPRQLTIGPLQRVELARQRRGDTVGNLDPAGAVCRCGRLLPDPDRTSELLEVKGIAAAEPVELLAVGGVE
jgi:hypothetical protein